LNALPLVFLVYNERRVYRENGEYF